jgi:hypothetical protein
MSLKRESRPRLKSMQPLLEELESRLAPATFQVSSIGGLISAIQSADGNSDTINTIEIASGTYHLSGATSSEILIQDQPAAAKLLIVKSQTGASVTIAGDTGDGSWKTRILEINGNSNFSVKIEQVNLSGGRLIVTHPNTPAQGGGILINGGNVTLSGAVVSGNSAVGATGSLGARGASGQNGGNGGTGGKAQGGGIYMASGSLTLIDSRVEENTAKGGNGGAGGAGGNQKTSYAPTSKQIGSRDGAHGLTGRHATMRGAAGQNGGSGKSGGSGRQANSLNNAKGGRGGDGGEADGGGIYVASGELTVRSSTIGYNNAIGGRGASGGVPGIHVSVSRSGISHSATRGYKGGNGGAGGGGGGGSNGVNPTGKGGAGGAGGNGGGAGKGGDGVNGGAGGVGGDGGDGFGGGVYLSTGAVTFTSVTLNGNFAQGGFGGAGVAGNDGGEAGQGGSGGAGGAGGTGANGGVPTKTMQNGGPPGNGGNAGTADRGMWAATAAPGARAAPGEPAGQPMAAAVISPAAHLRSTAAQSTRTRRMRATEAWVGTADAGAAAGSAARAAPAPMVVQRAAWGSSSGMASLTGATAATLAMLRMEAGEVLAAMAAMAAKAVKPVAAAFTSPGAPSH